jgi:hypothetical protein
MVFPATSDKVGRRPVLIVGECMQLVGGKIADLSGKKMSSLIFSFLEFWSKDSTVCLVRCLS